MISDLVTSKTGWTAILAGLAWLLTAVAPVIPEPWGNLVTAVLGILAFYHIGNAVGQARAMGVKGV